MKVLQKKGARVEVWRDLAELSERAAELFIAAAYDGITSEGIFNVALSGGSTPKATYTRLAQRGESESTAWLRTHVYWSDERCVPPTDEQSNYRMAKESLLDHVPVAPQRIHRMHGEDEPHAAAQSYAALLAENLAAHDYRFGLILLGLGDDGHTASLFPHTPALDETERLVAANFVNKLQVSRLTLTLPLINRASNIIFLVSGAAKADALQLILEGDVDGRALPASLVQPVNGKLVWLVDEAAFSKMQATNSPL
jgi:6-phosphogluconolactonase